MSRNRHRVIVVATSLALCTGMPTASATGRHYTDPVASPRIVYPYVDGGRADAAAITFTRVADPVLSVYDVAGERVYRAPIESGRFWNPRLQGDVLGSDLTDEDGRVFLVCVNRRGLWDVGSRFCTKVRVVHVRVDVAVSHKRLGRVFYDKTVAPGCSVYRKLLAVWMDCDRDSSATVRYDLPRPALTSEQSFVGPASFAWKGRYWRWGDGLYWTRTIRGANVIAHGGFRGKLAWVKKIWTVRTEY
jgi:hypothetical protein